MIDVGAWEMTTFGKQFKVRYGKASPKEDRSPDGAVPVVGSAGEMARTGAPLVSEPCLVIGRKGNVGQTHLMLADSWPTDTTYYVLMRDDLDPKFLQYQLIARDLRQLDHSTTTPSLRRQDLESVPLAKPTLIEQRRIVEILEDHLSRLDAAADYVSAAAKRLDSLKARVLADLSFGDQVTLFSLAWDSGYGTSAKCVVGGPGPAVVRIPNLVDARIDLTDEKRVASTAVDVSPSMLAPGDLLIVRTNGSVDLIGRSAVVQTGIDAAFASYLIRYRLRSERVRPRWVQAMLSTPQARQNLESLAASSAGQHNLSLAKLNPLSIPVPSLDEQDAALNQLDNVDARIRSLRNELLLGDQRAASLRRALLAAAFSGKLTGRHTDDEVIEELAEAGA